MATGNCDEEKGNGLNQAYKGGQFFRSNRVPLRITVARIYRQPEASPEFMRFRPLIARRISRHLETDNEKGA